VRYLKSIKQDIKKNRLCYIFIQDGVENDPQKYSKWAY